MAKAKQSPEPGGSEQPIERRQNLSRHEPSRHEPSRHEPSLMSRFTNEIERLFEDFGLGRVWGEVGGAEWAPQIEVFESGGQFIVRAELPGLTSNDVKVDITDNALTIRGERKQVHKEEREGWYRSERSYGRFFRSIPVPEGINVDEASASFRDGVLEITMPAPKHEGAGAASK